MPPRIRIVIAFLALPAFVVLGARFAPRLLSLEPAASAQAVAFPINVTKTDDTNDGTCTVADCSLREAIILANADPDFFTINIPAGTYNLAIAGRGEDASATGDLDITESVIINGAGATTTIINGQPLDRVIDIRGAITVQITGVTVQGGRIEETPSDDVDGAGIRCLGATFTLGHSSVIANEVSDNNGSGGGVANLGGTMTINQSTIDGNFTAGGLSHLGGGGLANITGALTINESLITNNSSPNGGGILNRNNSTAPAFLIVNRSTISHNESRGGGGLRNLRSTFAGGARPEASTEIRDSIISDNECAEDFTGGGGIENVGGFMRISGSTIRGNAAAIGGGIASYGDAELLIVTTAVTGNTARKRGGGIDSAGTLDVVNSTVSGNKSNEDSGGIGNVGDLRLFNVTITGNRADDDNDGVGGGGGLGNIADTQMMNSIIAGNTDAGGEEVDCGTVATGFGPSTDNPITSLGFNIVQNTTGCTINTAQGDMSGIDPLLGALQDNGGPTLTHDIPLNSPAIDAGSPGQCLGADSNPLAADQRGIARPQGLRCDIGAYEREYFALNVSISGEGGSVFSSPSGINCGADCTEKYFPGTVVTLTPAESGDGTFLGWSGACAGLGPCTLTINGNHNATATFTDVHAAPGQLNTTFDGDGKLTGDLAQDFKDRATAVAIQDDHRVLVAGLTDGPNEGPEEDDSFPFLLRYFSNGQPDTTFNNTSIFTTKAALAGATVDVGEIALQPDGRIVLVATFLIGGPGGETQFLVLRYNSDGSLDDGGAFDSTPADTFGFNGKVLTNFSIRNDFAHAVTLQSDGRIVVAGEAGDNSHGFNTLFALARYNADGSLDNTFSSDGKVTTEFFSAVADGAHDVLVQPDGKIVAAGGASNDSLCVARFLENGALDTDFSSDGTLVVTTNLGPAFALSRQTIDGKLIVGGEGFLQRISSDGTLDNTLRVLNVPGDSDNTIERINDLSIFSNGKILVAGSTNGDFALAVHNPNGTLDTSFGDNGLVTTDFGADDAAHAVAAQGNTRLYAAGYSGLDFALARYGGVNNLFAVSFESLTYDMREDSGHATITLNLGGQVQGPVTVHYATSNGTATAGSDYTATTGAATFGSGELTTTFTIPVTSDTVEETVPETFFVTLSNPTNAVLASSTQATVRIEDNPIVIFDPDGDYSVFESQGSAVITVELGNRESSLPVTVEYRTVANTATEGADYTLTSGTLTFQPGVRSQTFTVPLTNDIIDEPDETVTLFLKNTVNASLPVAEQTLTIVDNSRAAVGSSSASEKDGSAIVHIQLDKVSPTDVSFTYATSAGTATPGQDYTNVTGTLTIQAGSVSGQFHVPVFHDEIYDPSETVLITLSNPSNASVSDSPGTLVILDPAIVVTSTAETPQGSSKCTLREAIQAANTDVAVNDCGTNAPFGQGPGGPDGSFSDVIYVPAGTYTFTTIDNSDFFGNGDGGNALPVVTSRMTINGAGAGATVIERATSAPEMRIFFVVHSLRLDGLTVRGGRGNEGAAARVGGGDGSLTVMNCLVSGNETISGGFFKRGGAIFADGGSGVTVKDSTFVNNVSSSHGAALAVHTLLTISNSDFVNNKANGSGGAVVVAGAPATISGSRFLNNSAISGGAILTNTTLTVSDSLIAGNVALATGGGIYHTQRSLTLLRSTVSNNSSPAASGGGIYGCGNLSPLFITDSTISGNTARGDGGGICGNNMTLVNTTVSGNRATGSGGGISIQGSTFEFNNVTITDNTADSDGNGDAAGGGVRADGVPGSLRNSIIAGNHEWRGYTDFYSGPTSATSRGYNIIGDKEGLLIVPTTGDQFGTSTAPVNARLGPLQFNGGLTRTHALLAGSPAIDAANPAAPGSGGDSAPANDQRGRPRSSVINTRADIGAFEISAAESADLSLVKSATPIIAYTGRQITYNLHASNNGPVPLDDVTVTDQLPAELTYVSATASQGACNQSGGLVTCNLGQLAPDSTAVVTIVVVSSATSGFTRNTANATTATSESDLSNNSAIFTSAVKLPIAVNTTAQTSGSATDCTLSQAIEAANSDAPAGGCVAGAPGTDLITVPAGTYTLDSAPYSAFGQPVGLPLIQSDIQIEGAGAATTLIRRNPAAPEFRLLHLFHTPQGRLTLTGVTLANGRAPSGPGGAIANTNGSGPLVINDCVLSNNTTVNGGGGAIQLVGATLTINNGTFTDNSAGGGQHGGAVHMGGALSGSDVPVLTVNNSSFTSNSAGGNGGAIQANTVEITGTTFSGNSGSSGGAVSGTILNVSDSLVSANQSTQGGGDGGGGLSYVTLVLRRSTISGNQTPGGGGGLKGTSTTLIDSTVANNTAGAAGGGVRGGNHVTVTNSTISGNSAAASGGGISLQGSLFLNNATITNNTADSGNTGAGHAGGGIRADGSSGTIKNSIIAGNHEFRGSVDIYTGTTSLVSNGHNLIGDNSGCNIAPTTGDQFGTSSSRINPLLGALQNNGGPTHTHALLANSPAIDTANPATPDGTGNSCLPTDQRGEARPKDGDNDGVIRCDIGAFELQVITPTPTPTPSPSPSPNTDTGSNVMVQTTDGSVVFAGVSEAGTTTFTPITPNPGELPAGYAFCPTCPAFDITTTANYSPPVTVCLAVPAEVDQQAYLLLKLMHGENGAFVDRTTGHFTDAGGGRFVCGVVQSLSPFALASSVAPTAADGIISGRILDDNGMPVEGVVISLGGTQNRKTITNAKGDYYFDNIETMGFYTVAPSRANYNFNPFNRSFSQLGNHTEAAFGASFNGDSANPLDTPEFFVRQQYVDILGREPDESGFNYWSDEILRCGSDAACVSTRRRDIAAAFFIEQEFQHSGSFIYNLYSAALGRKPRYTEYATDRRQVVGGASLETEKAAFAELFVQRTDFVQKYQANTSADSFVDALLATVQQSTGVELGSQRASLIGAYQSGSSLVDSRTRVLRSVADDASFKQAQYNAAFVLTEYFGYLRRDPEPDGYDFWLNVLHNREPGNFHGMVCSFITSTEYQKRFSSVVTHSNAECGP